MLCSSIIDTPQVRFLDRRNVEAGVVNVLASGPCDTTWHRYRARWTAPESSDSVYPDFRFTFAGSFQYARYVEFGGLAFTLVVAPEQGVRFGGKQ